MKTLRDRALEQFEPIEAFYGRLNRAKKNYDFTLGIDAKDVTEFNTACVALIERIAGAESAYHKQTLALITRYRSIDYPGLIPLILWRFPFFEECDSSRLYREPGGDCARRRLLRHG